jgi:hypothetical protein
MKDLAEKPEGSARKVWFSVNSPHLGQRIGNLPKMPPAGGGYQDREKKQTQTLHMIAAKLTQRALRFFLCQVSTSCMKEMMNDTLEAKPTSASTLSGQAIAYQRLHGSMVTEKLPSGC